MPCKVTHAAVRILGATGLLLWAASALASCPVIQSTGLSCEPIDSPAARLMRDDKERVMLFFTYRCPKCTPVHEAVSRWEAAAGRPFVQRAHVSFTRGTELARTHYALMQLGLETAISPQMFRAIKDRTFKEGGDEVAGWVMSRDMAAGQRFIGLRDSANADDYAAAVTKLVRDLDINTVPTFIVNSRYRVVVTDAMPETISELELVVNSLRRQR